MYALGDFTNLDQKYLVSKDVIDKLDIVVVICTLTIFIFRDEISVCEVVSMFTDRR